MKKYFLYPELGNLNTISTGSVFWIVSDSRFSGTADHIQRRVFCRTLLNFFSQCAKFTFIWKKLEITSWKE